MADVIKNELNILPISEMNTNLRFHFYQSPTFTHIPTSFRLASHPTDDQSITAMEKKSLLQLTFLLTAPGQ